MANPTTFDEYVATRSPRLLRTAYLLTHDHALAEDLVQTALTRSWRAWDRIEGDPEPFVRKTMANTYYSWWRRRWNGERPTDEMPERSATVPQQLIDDRDELWRALGRSPRQQRAAAPSIPLPSPHRDPATWCCSWSAAAPSPRGLIKCRS